jgi:hypothetical protein
MNCELCPVRACCGLNVYDDSGAFELKHCCPEHYPKYCNNLCASCRHIQRLAATALRRANLTGPYTFPSRQFHNGSSQVPTNLRSGTIGTVLNRSYQIDRISIVALTRMSPEDTSPLSTIEGSVSGNSEPRGHGNDQQCTSTSVTPRP